MKVENFDSNYFDMGLNSYEGNEPYIFKKNR